jgi:hypothetical protein
MVGFLTANWIDAADAGQLGEPDNDVLVSHRDLDFRLPFAYEAAFTLEYPGKPGDFRRSNFTRCNWRPIPALSAHGGLEVHRPNGLALAPDAVM